MSTTQQHEHNTTQHKSPPQASTPSPLHLFPLTLTPPPATQNMRLVRHAGPLNHHAHTTRTHHNLTPQDTRRAARAAAGAAASRPPDPAAAAQRTP
eukprot:1142851-Pelagomonas_calceolata.AAC.5